MKVKTYPSSISDNVKEFILTWIFASNKKHLSAPKLKSLPDHLKRELFLIAEKRGLKTSDIQEAIYWIMHDLLAYPKLCVECGKPVQFRSYSEAYMYDRCSSTCSNNSELVIKKKKETCLKTYGTEHHFSSESVKMRAKEKHLATYGVVSNMQRKDVFLKNMKSQFRLKDYILPSGRVIKLMGYEPQVLSVLLETEYKEEDFDFDNIPSIVYGEHAYHPDFFIPKENLLIEVKSVWTYNVDLEKNLLKAEASRNAGFKHMTLIWDKNKLIIK